MTIPKDAFNLPRGKIDWTIRIYDDGRIFAQSYGGDRSEVVQIYPWKQGEMGHAQIKA